jgi:membrane protease YdiL (CAAX protease family)
MASFFLDETGRLRTFWRFAIFGAGFFTIQIGVGIMASIAVLVYLVATGTPLNSFANNFQVLNDWLVPLQMIAAIPMTFCSLTLVLLCRRFLDRRSVWSVGLSRPGRSLTDSVAGGLLFGAVPVVLAIGIVLATGGFVWEGISASAQTALLVPVLVIMAFFEEIVCRGYLLQNLIDIRRPWFGVLFSSSIFWILHGLNPDAWSSPIITLNLFGAGVSLALAYIVSRNIWFPTAVHFGWNFAQGVLFQVPISGLRTDGLLDVRFVETAPAWLTGGAFGIEGSILATAAEIGTSIVFGIVLLKRARLPSIFEYATDSATATVKPTAGDVTQSPFIESSPGVGLQIPIAETPGTDVP